MEHKAGYISIIGKPNAGKSTLINALLGEKLSIITPKAQTTRHRVLGILSTDDYQIVFSDTPGIIDPKYGLQKSMMKFVDESLEDVDVVVLLLDIGEKDLSEEVALRLRNIKVPLIVALNKIDIVKQEDVLAALQHWKTTLNCTEIIPISALNKFNVKELTDVLVKYLPEGPPYFPPDQLTDRPERFFASEIIREKIFLRYKKEIPYASEVIIEQFKEEESIIRINAAILVERDSQKGIIIGNKGSAIKNTGTAARKELENFFQKKIYLELFVKVREKWRDNPSRLKEFGYEK